MKVYVDVKALRAWLAADGEAIELPGVHSVRVERLRPDLEAISFSWRMGDVSTRDWIQTDGPPSAQELEDVKPSSSGDRIEPGDIGFSQRRDGYGNVMVTGRLTIGITGTITERIYRTSPDASIDYIKKEIRHGIFRRVYGRIYDLARDARFQMLRDLPPSWHAGVHPQPVFAAIDSILDTARPSE